MLNEINLMLEPSIVKIQQSRIVKQHDSIMVVVYKLTKAAHLILLQCAHKVVNIGKIFMKKVVKLHRVLRAIVSDRDMSYIFVERFSLCFGHATELCVNLPFANCCKLMRM
jgi:hypothetical protein